MTKDFLFNLHLFDGGAAGASGSAGAQGTSGTAEGSGEGNGNSNDSAVAAGQQTGETIRTDVTEDKHVAGADGEGQGNPVTSNTLEDRRKAYQKLISGEYKDLYEADTQKMVNRRFKETKNLQAQVEAAQPIMEMLMNRYGVEDAASLQAAIEGDNSYWEQAAYEAGVDVPTYMEMMKLRAENQAFKKLKDEQESRDKANEQLAEWTRQAEEVKQKYPNFNLEQEVQNEDFVRLLSKQIPVEHAYKLLHFDEIMNTSISQTQASTESRVLENIRAGGARPTEAGLNSQNATSTHIDVTKLNKKQRAEFAKRAARGENITF